MEAVVSLVGSRWAPPPLEMAPAAARPGIVTRIVAGTVHQLLADFLVLMGDSPPNLMVRRWWVVW